MIEKRLVERNVFLIRTGGAVGADFSFPSLFVHRRVKSGFPLRVARTVGKVLGPGEGFGEEICFCCAVGM